MCINNDQIKLLIQLSDTVEEADGVISEYTEYKSYEEKLGYLKELFDFEIMSRKNEDLESDYYSVLTAIINQKWRS